MKPSRLLVPVFAATLLFGAGSAQAAPTTASAPGQYTAWQTVKSDYRNFYLSRARWRRLGIAFGVGAIMANTHIDEGIRDWYQNHERSPGTNRISHDFKKLGNGKYLIPLSLLAAGVGMVSHSKPTTAIGQWGARTFRAYLVAGPAVLLAQTLTGGARPGTRSYASHWRPFQKTHGVSGNAFIGAVPFLTIADMTHNRFVRYTAYFASTIAAWTRVNDDAHFTSQAFLGWYMAYEGVNAVNDTNKQQQRGRAHLSIIPVPQGGLAEVSYRW